MKKECGNDRTLVLNAGNNFDSKSHDFALAGPFIVNALGISGTEVIAPGVSEIVAGLEKLNQMAENVSLQMISANLPGFMPYAVLLKNRGRMKVLVTSVMDPDLLIKRDTVPAKAPADPVSVLRRIHERIPHDLFVVIMHADPEMISTVVEKCPGIDLVIDALSSDFSLKQTPGGSPPIVANNKEGMYVAYVDYDGRNEKDVPIFSDPVAQRAVVGQVAEDSQISALVKEYELKRRNKLREKTDARQPEAEFKVRSHYVGSRSCTLCHAEINDSWASSRHAEAMDSLVEQSRQNDPDCLLCHVTGMEKQPPSSTGLWIKEDHPMAGVQCEACHGPGADHSQNPENFDMRKVDENTCTRCHTKFKDPGFDYSRDIYKVKHGQVKIGLSRAPVLVPAN